MERIPKLRPVEVFPVQQQGKRMVALHDPTGISPNTLVLSEAAFAVMTMFDGEHTVKDIQEDVARRFGTLLMSDEITKLVEILDEKLMLESDRFREHVETLLEEYRRAPTRKPTHAGKAYPEDPKELKERLSVAWGDTEAPQIEAHRVSGIIAPHIDYGRGGHAYAQAYRHLASNRDADTFVVIGTLHTLSANPAILTAKPFETPIGESPVEEDFVEELCEAMDWDCRVDELNHLYEHSIELQVVFLQFVLGNRSHRIVPVLCPGWGTPEERRMLDAFAEVLRESVKKRGERVALIAGADLAHVGARFGDRRALTDDYLSSVRRQDLNTLDYVLARDADAFAADVLADDNARRICGLSAIYLLLKTIEADSAEILCYDQAVDLPSQTCVSFASVAFYKKE